MIEKLTEIVERAVYREFEAISRRGGVLGAMETMHQRSKIQEESLFYERKKHDGSLPIIGVNTFLPRKRGGDIVAKVDLVRSSDDEKRRQIANVAAFRHARNEIPYGRPGEQAGGESGTLEWLQRIARGRRNVFAALMEVAKFYSLGQITSALYNVGGEYRRNM